MPSAGPDSQRWPWSWLTTRRVGGGAAITLSKVRELSSTPSAPTARASPEPLHRRRLRTAVSTTYTCPLIAVRTGWVRNAVQRRCGPECGRWIGPLLILALGGLGGCSPYQLAKRTLHYELNEYPRLTDGTVSCREYKRWAQEEWALLAAEAPGGPFSPDYKSGFLQGFVDHVYAGGRVTPPVMPPRRYWRLSYRNQEGQEAVRQWYAGFEHGARVAQEKGYRDLAVIPSSLFGGSDARHGALIEIESQVPLDEPVPAVPDGPQLWDDELPPPSPLEPEPAGASAFSPAGLPLPTTDQPPPAPGRALSVAVSPAVDTPVTSTATESTATESSSEIVPTGEPPSQHMVRAASAADLDLTPEADGPPVPPWRQQRAAPPRLASAAGDIALAAAEQPLNAKAEVVTAVGSDAQEQEFDPFAGTRFARLSQAAGRPEDTVPAESSDTNPDLPVTPPGPHSLTSPEQASRPPQVRPLDVIRSVPQEPSLTAPPRPQALAPEASSRDSTSGNSAPAASDGTPSPPERTEWRATDRPGQPQARTPSAPTASVPPSPAGWHPIEPQTAGEWKSKD
jgi:hypothetical protein